MTTCRFMETDDLKLFASPKFNYVFDKRNGKTCMWGETQQDDPDYAPMPVIADIEVTTICSGVNNRLCKFCYKSNSPDGKNMSFETFKMLFDKFPEPLTQIAFGADSHAESNPDLWKMMDYCRNNGRTVVIPNITVAQITEETADKLAKYCGAVAVSRYEDEDVCYDTIKMLTDRGMTQINMHYMISQETLDNAYKTIDSIASDPRLSKLNAIVLLSLKRKGRGTGFTPLTQDEFKSLIDYAREKKVRYGCDSCSGHKLLESLKSDPEEYKKQSLMIMPCESTCESIYCGIPINGDNPVEVFPCSFCEGESEWINGIPVTNETDFVKDIWFSERMSNFRKKLLEGNRHCPMFEV